MNQRLKLYTFDNYYEYEWLWCENWNPGRYWDHALETVNCVCSGKCCRQLIPKCDRPGEVRVFVAVLMSVCAWMNSDLCVWFWCQLELIGLIEDLPMMLPTKFQFIWPSGFRGEYFYRNRPIRHRIRTKLPILIEDLP
jgi:hypothetical protein